MYYTHTHTHTHTHCIMSCDVLAWSSGETDASRKREVGRRRVFFSPQGVGGRIDALQPRPLALPRGGCTSADARARDRQTQREKVLYGRELFSSQRGGGL